jgi:hypothetical protein
MKLSKIWPKGTKKPAEISAGYVARLVPKAGLEPARVSPLPPQDSVSTKFHHFGTFTKRIPEE